jgi:hypothetical protein
MGFQLLMLLFDRVMGTDMKKHLQPPSAPLKLNRGLGWPGSKCISYFRLTTLMVCSSQRGGCFTWVLPLAEFEGKLVAAAIWPDIIADEKESFGIKGLPVGPHVERVPVGSK